MRDGGVVGELGGEVPGPAGFGEPDTADDFRWPAGVCGADAPAGHFALVGDDRRSACGPAEDAEAVGEHENVTGAAMIGG